jgi:hypothetical protein
MSQLTIDRLIEMLEDARNVLGGDAVVRSMTQANYPMEYNIAGVATSAAIEQERAYQDGEIDEDEYTGDEPTQVTGEAVLYLVEGSQIGYGNKAAWDVLEEA